jgi:hypothetical protein
LFASRDEIPQFFSFEFGNFHRFEFVSDFEFRISDFRLRRLCAHRASVVNSLLLYRQIGGQDRSAG